MSEGYKTLKPDDHYFLEAIEMAKIHRSYLDIHFKDPETNTKRVFVDQISSKPEPTLLLTNGSRLKVEDIDYIETTIADDLGIDMISCLCE